MNQTSPRTLAEMQNRPTRYEVVLSHPERDPITIAFTPRATRAGLIKALQIRGDEILAHTGITDADEAGLHQGYPLDCRFR